MILGDSAAAAAAPPHARNRLTIDEVFRRLAERRPDALALADAPNRQTFTDGAPRRLTFAEADRMVTAIAGRLRGMGLPTDAIVGIQLPNIVENILTMLGVLRAGMIVAPLPLLWRRADAVAALGRIGAKALITCGHVGAFDHSQFALRVAAEVFSIRYVCGFGSNLPDGVVPFDDLFTADKLDPIPPLDRERQSNAAAHVAAVTFDVGDGGIVPVARNHPELLAAGLAVVLESRLPHGASILSALPPSSFAGISLTLLPWLLTGGTLVLHHAFDPDIFAAQRQDDRCGALILPAPAVFNLAEAGAFAGDDTACVIAAWRAPERLATESGLARTERCAGRRFDLRRSRSRSLAPRRLTARRARFASVRCWRSATARAASRLPNSCGPTPARSRCAVRWCRIIPSRPGSNAPACPISRSGTGAWSTPDMPAGSIPAATPSR